MQLKVISTLLAFLSCFSLREGMVTPSPSGYVTYHVGDPNSRVVISAPHGGKLKPTLIPSRPSQGCYNAINETCVYEINCQPKVPKKCETNLVPDFRTDQLAEEILAAFPVGLKPHVIICELHRSKLDANREVTEATFGNGFATSVWNLYHDSITAALDDATDNGMTRALYVDLHGNGQEEMWNMVGMLITNSQLKQNPIPNSLSASSSLEMIYTTSGESMEDLVRGSDSIGGLLEAKGYPMVPSPNNPDAGNAKFFSGGYSTKKHTGGIVSGFQMEVYKTWRFPNDALRQQFAADLTDVIQEWIANYY